MPTILALTDIFGFLEEHAMEGKVEIDVWTRPKQHMSVTRGGRGCTRIADGEYSESHLRLLKTTPLGPRWVLLVILDFSNKFLAVIKCHVASFYSLNNLVLFGDVTLLHPTRIGLTLVTKKWTRVMFTAVTVTPGIQFVYTNSSVNR